MTAERRAVQVVISGRVQGVGYRAWTFEQAGLRGLCGWVRNRPEGTVEALFTGDALDVDAMLDSCWKGPPGALVTDLKVAEIEDPGLDAFALRG